MSIQVRIGTWHESAQIYRGLINIVHKYVQTAAFQDYQTTSVMDVSKAAYALWNFPSDNGNSLMGFVLDSIVGQIRIIAWWHT